jgi:choline kinase
MVHELVDIRLKNDNRSKSFAMGNNTLQTAVILAAGLGTRLLPLTSDRPKCLVEVDGKPMLQRMLEEVIRVGFTKVILVTGYRSDKLKQWLDANPQPISIEFIHNEVFDTTNNIYSVFKLIPVLKEGFVLIEADLLLQSDALEAFRTGDRIALAAFNPNIHSGTTADVDGQGNVASLYMKAETDYTGAYKTVNITSFSSTSWNKLGMHITSLVKSGKDQIFYEQAIQDLIGRGELSFECVDFTRIWWDEIDSVEDLDRATSSLRQLDAVES